jgi:hypothetical protein
VRVMRLGFVSALVTAGVMAAALAGPASAGTRGPDRPAAPTRPGVVLVNQPASSVCVGKTFRVGVWYQQSGGSRAYRVDVYSPHGQRVLYKHGQAPSAQWRFWKVRARVAGKYRTVYWTHVGHSGAWSAYRATTRARHC